MFNNVALDVVIGLTFIFLLYSLLATTINEFIAMILAYRHRMLEKAIEQMLDGKNYSYYWWDKVANFFFWLYHQVQIKIAEKTGTIKKVSNKDFFKTCSINHYQNTPALPHTYRRKLNKKAALFAANITNHPLYRRKSEDSLLYKKPAYLSSSTFADILLDIFSNNKSDNSSTPILMNDIKSFVGNKLDNNADLKSIINLYIEQANGDVQKFKLLLENWYDDTMERVSGWYKRQATKVLFAIGLALAITFNVSTIDIVHKLSVNKDLREAMSQSALNYIKHRSDKPNSNLKDSTDSTMLSEAKAQLKDIQKLYNDSIAPVNSMMGLGWDFSNLNTCKRQWYFKVQYILKQTTESSSKWIGFLITALALTLGAPFWFDLLNKFVNIRGGGNKPSEGSGAPTSAQKTALLNQKPNPKSFA